MKIICIKYIFFCISSRQRKQARLSLRRYDTKAYPHVLDHAYAKEKLIPKSNSPKQHETRENLDHISTGWSKVPTLLATQLNIYRRNLLTGATVFRWFI
jgi:hypothetical protein